VILIFAISCRVERLVDLGGWLCTETVQLPAHSQLV